MSATEPKTNDLTKDTLEAVSSRDSPVHDATALHNSSVSNMNPERRKQVEKSLKRKLDARCSLFVLIYIMNCEPSHHNIATSATIASARRTAAYLVLCFLLHSTNPASNPHPSIDTLCLLANGTDFLQESHLLTNDTDLDRNNIAAARLGGLEDDLGINSTQYATCLSILYVGYILMQVPSNIIINRISRPSWYISAAMLLWGLISTLSGNTHNFAGMVAVRFFIGFVEAAFLPGALLILSKWYTKRELTTRNAILFCGNLISNAFSALVGAAVLSNMEGTLGHRAWRWLYWIEGAVTMFIAILAAFILPDLPHNSRGFTAEEREVAVLRMTEDVGEADKDSDEMGPLDGLWMCLKDTKIYIMMFTFTAYVVGLSFNAFFPTLTQTLGFSHIPTLLMSSPPWAFSCIVSLINAWHTDRTQEKFWHMVIPILGGLVGFIISMSTENVAARYVALFLQASAYAGFIVFYSWISSSFPRPPAKRAVAIALVNAFSQLGNIAGSYVWDLPEHGFRKSYGIVTAMFGVTILGIWTFRMILVRLNKKIEAGERAWETRADVAAETAATEGVTVEEGQKLQRGFRYMI